MRKVLYILLISSTILFIGCENALGPDFQSESNIKTETKWRVSSVTNQKIDVISFKEYSKNGNIISEIDYNQNNEKVYSKFEYKKGKKIEHEYQISGNGDTTMILVHNYELREGKVTKKVTETIDGTLINSEQFVYDLNGNLTEKSTCDNGENCNNTIKYDNLYTEGNLTVRYTFEKDGTIAQKDSLVYNNKQNYFERITSDDKGNIYFVTEYNIDDKGKVKSETIKSNKGEIIDKYIYEFTYFE